MTKTKAEKIKESLERWKEVIVVLSNFLDEVANLLMETGKKSKNYTLIERIKNPKIRELIKTDEGYKTLKHAVAQAVACYSPNPSFHDDVIRVCGIPFESPEDYEVRIAIVDKKATLKFRLLDWDQFEDLTEDFPTIVAYFITEDRWMTWLLYDFKIQLEEFASVYVLIEEVFKTRTSTIVLPLPPCLNPPEWWLRGE